MNTYMSYRLHFLLWYLNETIVTSPQYAVESDPNTEAWLQWIGTKLVVCWTSNVECITHIHCQTYSSRLSRCACMVHS